MGFFDFFKGKTNDKGDGKKSSPAATLTLTPSRTFDENSPHGVGGRGKKMAFSIPVLRVLLVDQPQVRFMHQRRRLQRVPSRFVCHFGPRNSMKFLVNERQQPCCRVRVAILHLFKYLCDLAHVLPS